LLPTIARGAMIAMQDHGCPGGQRAL